MEMLINTESPLKSSHYRLAILFGINETNLEHTWHHSRKSHVPDPTLHRPLTHTHLSPPAPLHGVPSTAVLFSVA